MEKTEEILHKTIKRINQMTDNLESDKEKIKEQLDILIKIFQDVVNNSIFSPNESFEEILTENLRYLLVPFYQGEVLLLLQENREKNLSIVVRFYEEFFKVLQDYKFLDKTSVEQYNTLFNEIVEAENKGKENSNNYEKISQKQEKLSRPDMSKMTIEREAKIQEYKYKKSLLDKIALAEKKNEDYSRDFWIDYLNLSWKKMIENMKAIKMELESMSFLKNMKKEGKYQDFSAPVKQTGKMEVMKITPDNIKNLDPQNKLMQNLMFGNSNCNDCTNVENIIDNKLNYKDKVFRNPNPTTMTMDEFAELQMKTMEENQVKEQISSVKKAEEDELSDADEEVDARRKKEKRDWDDWKDLNEKGMGNKGGK